MISGLHRQRPLSIEILNKFNEFSLNIEVLNSIQKHNSNEKYYILYKIFETKLNSYKYNSRIVSTLTTPLIKTTNNNNENNINTNSNNDQGECSNAPDTDTKRYNFAQVICKTYYY